MVTIPVLATVLNAYRFLFRFIGPLVRISWLPLVLLAALQIFAELRIIDDVVRNEPSARVLIVSTVMAVVSAVIFTAIAVAVHRIVLFGVDSTGPHLSFGGMELRFIGVAILSALFAAAIGLVWGITAAIATYVFGSRGAVVNPVSTTLVFLLAVVAFGVGAFVLVRLWPVLPLIVATGRINLVRAWHMTRGHFWRLLGIGVVTYLPLLGVGLVLMPLYWLLFAGVSGPADLVARAPITTPIVVALNTAIGFVATVVYAASLCFAFKAINGLAPGETVDEAAVAAQNAPPPSDPT